MIVGLLPVAAVVGLVVLFVGLKGAANHAESVCDADIAARRGYGAWSMSSDLWPPSFECEIGGADVETLTISHPTTALVGFVAMVVVPTGYIALVLVLIGWLVRRPDRRMGQPLG